MSDLKNKLIKLAYEKKELRKDLLPLLKEAGYFDPPEDPPSEFHDGDDEIKAVFKGTKINVSRHIEFDEGEYGREGTPPSWEMKVKMTDEQLLVLLRNLLSKRSLDHNKKDMKMLVQQLASDMPTTIKYIENEWTAIRGGDYGYIYAYKRGNTWNVTVRVG